MPKITTYLVNGLQSGDFGILARSGTNRKFTLHGAIALNGYKISPSISGNDLVLALTDLDGNDFEISNTLYIKVFDTNLTINSVLSVTKAAGTNWANLGASEHATQDVDLFAYLIQETGASAGNKLGWSRYPAGIVVGDFSSTTTNSKYLAGPTNYNATDKVQLIGRFNATLSAGAGYTWSLPATSVIVNIPIFETRWLDWVPTITGYSSNPGTATYQYKIKLDSCVVRIDEQVNGTSNAITKTYSAPFPCGLSAANYALFTLPIPVDNGATKPGGYGQLKGGTTDMQMFLSAAGAWTGSGACRLAGLSATEYPI